MQSHDPGWHLGWALLPKPCEPSACMGASRGASSALGRPGVKIWEKGGASVLLCKSEDVASMCPCPQGWPFVCFPTEHPGWVVLVEVLSGRRTVLNVGFLLGLWQA